MFSKWRHVFKSGIPGSGCPRANVLQNRSNKAKLHWTKLYGHECMVFASLELSPIFMFVWRWLSFALTPVRCCHLEKLSLCVKVCVRRNERKKVWGYVFTHRVADTNGISHWSEGIFTGVMANTCRQTVVLIMCCYLARFPWRRKHRSMRHCKPTGTRRANCWCPLSSGIVAPAPNRIAPLGLATLFLLPNFLSLPCDVLWCYANMWKEPLWKMLKLTLNAVVNSLAQTHNIR